MDNGQVVYDETNMGYGVEAAKPRLFLGLIGALIGGGIIAVIWCVVGYYTGFEIGWLAIFAGGLSGLLAALFAGRQSTMLGIIAAVVGVAAIAAGSGGNYYFSITSDKAKAELKEHFNQIVRAEGIVYASEAEREESWQQYYRDCMQGHPSFEGYKMLMLSTPKDYALMALFIIFGLSYGFQKGAGSSKGNKDSSATERPQNFNTAQNSQEVVLTPAKTESQEPQYMQPQD